MTIWRTCASRPQARILHYFNVFIYRIVSYIGRNLYSKHAPSIWFCHMYYLIFAFMKRWCFATAAMAPATDFTRSRKRNILVNGGQNSHIIQREWEISVRHLILIIWLIPLLSQMLILEERRKVSGPIRFSPVEIAYICYIVPWFMFTPRALVNPHLSQLYYLQAKFNGPKALFNIHIYH